MHTKLGDTQAGLGKEARQLLVISKMILSSVGFDSIKIYFNLKLN
jgi:hypothetical protein